MGFSVETCDSRVVTSPANSQELVRLTVAELISGIMGDRHGIERRRGERRPFPRLIRLTPVDDDGRPRDDLGVVVSGKDLSARGVGFFHPQPLPYRHVIITVKVGSTGPVSLMAELTRCRFTTEGWYETGGRITGILQAAVPTAEEKADAFLTDP